MAAPALYPAASEHPCHSYRTRVLRVARVRQPHTLKTSSPTLRLIMGEFVRVSFLSLSFYSHSFYLAIHLTFILYSSFVPSLASLCPFIVFLSLFVRPIFPIFHSPICSLLAGLITAVLLWLRVAELVVILDRPCLLLPREAPPPCLSRRSTRKFHQSLGIKLTLPLI